MSGALQGIRIIDLTANVTGPYATMMLADQGADVLKIEQPPHGDVMRYLGSHRGGITALFASCNRSKRSIVLNLKEDAARGIVRELALEADVFVQNFRPGVIDRLGLGEADLRSEHPELIYVSMNAFGESGPYAGRPAYDHILQGMTGAAYVQADPPQYMRQAWCDKATGVTAAQAITAALFARERGAGGQHVRLSMLDASISFLWPDGHIDTMLLEDEGTVRVPPISGTYVPVETADGFATIAAGSPDQRDRLLAVLDRVDLLVDPRFATLDAFLENLDAFRAEVLASQKGRTTAELLEALREADVPCGPVLRLHEVPDFPQVVANETLIASEHPQMGRIREPRPAARFEATPSAIRNPAPTLGQHTDEVLRELGHSTDEIGRLRSEGAVA
jgi:crotonobetainyl-CoA:carnitine CoA-transferase CaiB-like acyl-CoA transferase